MRIGWIGVSTRHAWERVLDSYAALARDSLPRRMSGMAISCELATNLTPGETVVLYPTFGHLVEGGRKWRIAVHGNVFEAGQLDWRKRLLLRLLQGVMQARPEDLDTELFRQRIRGFIAGTERGRRIFVRIGSRLLPVRRATNRNGHFSGAIRIPVDELPVLEQSAGGTCWLRFDPDNPHGASGNFPGRAHLLQQQGISVISDIDDTIKHSEVLSRRELLANTFLHEFRCVEGMAERYREWARQGAAFHYVSASPWQLFQPLFELFESAGFPAGSFHLRAFCLRDHMVRRMLLIRCRGKALAIEGIIQAFFGRRFLLIGDSGEKDPEIYADMARRYPRQIAGIFIRNLTSRPLDEQRLRRVFRDIPASPWRSFTCPEELPDLLPGVNSL